MWSKIVESTSPWLDLNYDGVFVYLNHIESYVEN